MRRAVEHRALMAIAIGDPGRPTRSSRSPSTAARPRLELLYAHTPARAHRSTRRRRDDAVARVWESLRILHDSQISHGDLRASEITRRRRTVLFGGFDMRRIRRRPTSSCRSDIAQLLVTTSALYDAPSARCAAAIDAFGKDAVLTASRAAHEIRCAHRASASRCRMPKRDHRPRATR